MLDIEKENEIRRLCRKYSADQLARMYLEAAEKGERRAERAEMRMVEFAERCEELENERAAMIEIIGDCRELCGICRNEPPEDCQRDCVSARINAHAAGARITASTHIAGGTQNDGI